MKYTETINPADVTWTKHETGSYDENGEPYKREGDYCVVGTVNEEEVGHYLYEVDANCVFCVISVGEENGNTIFMNNCYPISEYTHYDDNFFRERILLAHNNYHKIREIFN